MDETSPERGFSLARQPSDPAVAGGGMLGGEQLAEWESRFSPLLKYLRKRKVVLVLSGGGMAMPCHVSVLRVLQILDIPIAAVYGTSAGAVIGGLFAAGIGVSDLERIMLGIKSSDELFGFASRHPAMRLAAGQVVRTFAPPSLDRSGIYGFGRVEEYLRGLFSKYLGKVPTMSDLKMPFSCVALDIGSGDPGASDQQRVAKTVFSAKNSPGVSLADAIAASMAIPGTLPPKKIGDRYHIDGATVEHLPIVTAFDDWGCRAWWRRRRTAAIAVDLGYGGHPPAKESLRFPMDVVMYSSSIQGRAITDYSLLHCHRPITGFSVVLVRPRTFSIGLCDTEKIPAIMESAYYQTVEQLSGPDFLGRTTEHIRSAGMFLGIRGLHR